MEGRISCLEAFAHCTQSIALKTMTVMLATCPSCSVHTHRHTNCLLVWSGGLDGAQVLRCTIGFRRSKCDRDIQLLQETQHQDGGDGGFVS